jgi:nucleoside-diphosphate-sugar epimerase
MLLSGKTLAITGIGGFIGLRAAELALQRGLRVRGLDLSAAAAERARRLGAEVLVGDITDPQAASELCRGADVVLHTAGVIKEGGPLELFRRVHVQGTLTVATAARVAGVQTFVHLSSVLVYGFSYPDGATEDTPCRGDNNPYCRTKIESEDALLPLNDPPRFGVIVLRPGEVYGPGSIPWVVRPLTLMRRGRFFLVNGGLGVINTLYVDNLIDAIFLAVERDAWGEVFNVTDGRTVTCREYFDRLTEAAGLPPPRSLPAVVLRLLVCLLIGVQRLLGREPDLSTNAIRFVMRKYGYAIAKARSRLGYEPCVDLEEGMRRTAAWLRDTGLVTGPGAADGRAHAAGSRAEVKPPSRKAA